MQRLVHLLNGLTIGGKERIALRLARRARRENLDHRLLVYDTGFRDPDLDLDPGDVPVELLPRGPGLDLRFAAAVARRLTELGVQVVHAHNDSGLVYGVLAVRRIRRDRPRLLATFHTRPSHPTFGARLLSRWASKRADVVTAVSPDLREFLQQRRWIGSCELVWNGVDLDEYRPDGPTDGWRERLGVAPGALLVGFVGRYHRVKRQEDLLAAARLLRDVTPPLVFAFVGDGPGRDDFAAAARDEPLVRIIPRVHDMAAFYRELDVYVICSIEEAAPLVLLEAMASGCPVVSTDIGSLPYLVGATEGRSCARLVPPRSPEALAAVLRGLASDPEARAELGRRARAEAARFSEDREWQAYQRLYAADGGSDRSGRS